MEGSVSPLGLAIAIAAGLIVAVIIILLDGHYWKEGK